MIEEVTAILSEGQAVIKRRKEANDTSLENFNGKRIRIGQVIKSVSVYTCNNAHWYKDKFLSINDLILVVTFCFDWLDGYGAHATHIKQFDVAFKV